MSVKDAEDCDMMDQNGDAWESVTMKILLDNAGGVRFYTGYLIGAYGACAESRNICLTYRDLVDTLDCWAVGCCELELEGHRYLAFYDDEGRTHENSPTVREGDRIALVGSVFIVGLVYLDTIDGYRSDHIVSLEMKDLDLLKRNTSLARFRSGESSFNSYLLRNVTMKDIDSPVRLFP